MNETLHLSISKRLGLSTLVCLALGVQAHPVTAESISKIPGGVAQAKQSLLQQEVSQERRSQINHSSYILGPGDGLQIDLLDLPELSGNFSIGPDGTLYLPRLRALYVEGLTIDELNSLLTEQFRTYVRDPQVYIRPVIYRPVRLYVGGAVRRPGYYTLSGVQSFTGDISSLSVNQVESQSAGLTSGNSNTTSISGGSSSKTLFPTVFDAIRAAQGITPYSDLAKVQVTRKQAQGLGGGRIRTNLNFLSLITDGDESQNIRLFDGDVLNVSKSNNLMHDQLLKAGQTNLSPQFINVYDRTS